MPKNAVSSRIAKLKAALSQSQTAPAKRAAAVDDDFDDLQVQ